MKTMERWSDERLDDLNSRVGSGFDRIDADLRDIRGEMGSLRRELRGEMGSLRRELRGEMGTLRGEMGSLRRELRGEMGSLRGEMNSRFEQVDARFDSLQRTMLQLGGGVIVALIGLIATQL